MRGTRRGIFDRTYFANPVFELSKDAVLDVPIRYTRLREVLVLLSGSIPSRIERMKCRENRLMRCYVGAPHDVYVILIATTDDQFST